MKKLTQSESKLKKTTKLDIHDYKVNNYNYNLIQLDKKDQLFIKEILLNYINKKYPNIDKINVKCKSYRNIIKFCIEYIHPYINDKFEISYETIYIGDFFISDIFKLLSKEKIDNILNKYKDDYKDYRNEVQKLVDSFNLLLSLNSSKLNIIFNDEYFAINNKSSYRTFSSFIRFNYNIVTYKEYIKIKKKIEEIKL